MKLKVLQFIVGILAVAIVVAVGLVGYGLARNAKKLESKDAATAAAPSLTGSFGAVSLNEPDGTEITSVTAVGDRAVVALRGGNRPPRLVVLDPATGVVSGTVSVTP